MGMGLTVNYELGLSANRLCHKNWDFGVWFRFQKYFQGMSEYFFWVFSFHISGAEVSGLLALPS